jgi:phosphoribosylformylglycinamidine synthase
MRLRQRNSCMKRDTFRIHRTSGKRKKTVRHNGDNHFEFDIDHCRSLWYRSSYLLDRRQCGPVLARERYENHGEKALQFDLKNFKGSFGHLGITPDRRKTTGVRAAIIREKGVNGDREMAYALWLAGFDVKDVHMTDLISGRETLRSSI